MDKRDERREYWLCLHLKSKGTEKSCDNAAGCVIDTYLRILLPGPEMGEKRGGRGGEGDREGERGNKNENELSVYQSEYAFYIPPQPEILPISDSDHNSLKI